MNKNFNKIFSASKILDVEEAGGTATLTFRIAGNKNITLNSVEKAIKTLDPKASFKSNGDTYTYEGDNFRAVEKELGKLGLDIEVSESTHDDNDGDEDKEDDMDKTFRMMRETMHNKKSSDDDKISALDTMSKYIDETKKYMKNKKK